MLPGISVLVVYVCKKSGRASKSGRIKFSSYVIYSFILFESKQ